MRRCDKCRMPILSKTMEGHECVYEGMYIDDLIRAYPREHFVKEPTVFKVKDSGEVFEGAQGKKFEIPKLSVVYHFPGTDVRVGWSKSEDEELPMAGYFVQEIKELGEDVEGSD